MLWIVSGGCFAPIFSLPFLYGFGCTSSSDFSSCDVLEAACAASWTSMRSRMQSEMRRQ